MKIFMMPPNNLIFVYIQKNQHVVQAGYALNETAA